MAAGKSARKVIMKERNTTLETTDHNNRDNSENIKETPDERIPGKLIGAIVAVGSLAFIGILTETVMTVLFPQLMREFNVNTATVQWITTIYLLTVAATMPLSSYLNRKFKHRVLFLAAVALAVLGSPYSATTPDWMVRTRTYPTIRISNASRYDDPEHKPASLRIPEKERNDSNTNRTC